MIDLLELRDQIDDIDSQILQLFERRMDISKEVAAFKIETGKPVFDKKREQEKLKVLREKSSSEFNAHGIQELFQQIMAMSRKLQYQMLTENGYEEKTRFRLVDHIDTENARVVYQGIEGAYSHEATIAFFGKNVKAFHVVNWKDAMEMVSSGQADYAVLPIENSTAGSVYENYDLLEEYDHYIVGEQLVKCQHVLVGLPEAELSDIEMVQSHPQALMQCKPFLSEHESWKTVECGNTAVAAKMVADGKDKTKAALSSRYAAEAYGLKILEEHPYYNDYNSTRFIVVSEDKIFTSKARKISVCFEIPHESGSLYNILSHFIYNNLNMTKIESRPIYERSWEYRFFVDFEGSLNDSAVKNALRGLAAETSSLRVFGNY
ncbi:MAG: prephenate dehydratase [Lachnospiraceae bacterium]|nr:prephenate dehydratase [Lachnospiraceae bacterium]MDD3614631.1 prephenate dehydratase [Lachnospiraceae bacterium]